MMKSCNEPINEPINGPKNKSKTVKKQNKYANKTIGGLIGDPINEPPNEPIKQAIFRHVKQNPGCKRVDINTAVGLSMATLKRMLNLMKAEIEYRGSNKKGGYYVREEA